MKTVSRSSPRWCHRSRKYPSRRNPWRSSTRSERSFSGSTSASSRCNSSESNAKPMSTSSASVANPRPHATRPSAKPTSARRCAELTLKRVHVPTISSVSRRLMPHWNRSRDSKCRWIELISSDAPATSSSGGELQYRITSGSPKIENTPGASCCEIQRRSTLCPDSLGSSLPHSNDGVMCHSRS